LERAAVAQRFFLRPRPALTSFGVARGKRCARGAFGEVEIGAVPLGVCVVARLIGKPGSAELRPRSLYKVRPGRKNAPGELARPSPRSGVGAVRWRDFEPLSTGSRFEGLRAISFNGGLCVAQGFGNVP
jgi:hypothetical protein